MQRRRPRVRMLTCPCHVPLAPQTLFLTFAFGGSSTYSDDPYALFAAHAHLIKDRGLNLMHFDRVSSALGVAGMLPSPRSGLGIAGRQAGRNRVLAVCNGPIIAAWVHVPT